VAGTVVSTNGIEEIAMLRPRATKLAHYAIETCTEIIPLLPKENVWIYFYKLAIIALKSVECALPLKTFQLEFTKRTCCNQSTQLRIRCLADAAGLA
jgi:hypothetical protein